MTYREIYAKRQDYFLHHQYQFLYYADFDYQILHNIMYIKRPGRNSQVVSDCFIMLDTETSKTYEGEDFVCENYVVAWTISIRAFHTNICTLYGTRPSECMDCIQRLLDEIPGEIKYFYVHNLSYDYVFLRKFLFRDFGYPVKQLNTKPHYPIYVEFSNGLILRDSLILAQRKLERWAEDMDVEHKKAVGSWDYGKVRNQGEAFTLEELHYIENDTLAGAECLDALLTALGKKIYNIPWTATGIPRDEVKKRGKANRGNYTFKKQLLTYDQQRIMEKVFHGGYTHGNRYYYNETLEGKISCYDFSSSYPFVMMSEKFGSEAFTRMKDRSMWDILRDKDNNAYYFKLIMFNVRLKDHYYPMPCLQYSKCVKTINADVDNGRIISMDYGEIWLTESDLEIIAETYDIERHICVDVYASHKAYLPRWFTDYVYEQFEQKTRLKGGDRVLYNIAKGRPSPE